MCVCVCVFVNTCVCLSTEKVLVKSKVWIFDVFLLQNIQHKYLQNYFTQEQWRGLNNPFKYHVQYLKERKVLPKPKFSSLHLYLESFAIFGSVFSHPTRRRDLASFDDTNLNTLLDFGSTNCRHCSLVHKIAIIWQF